MRLLLLSNSTNTGEAYLDYPKYQIKEFLGKSIKEVLFFPYAVVTFSYNEYWQMVSDRFNEIGIKVKSIHNESSPINAIREAKTIVVGGGNTFKLLKIIKDNRFFEEIERQVNKNEIPYIGWSAGSNLACPTIRTTNDMPIVEPDDLSAFNFIPFQINPHYQDVNPEGHAGETREQRILEFIEMNEYIYVIGLREGTMLQVMEDNIKLIGTKPARIFKYGKDTHEVKPGDDLNFLLNK